MSMFISIKAKFVNSSKIIDLQFTDTEALSLHAQQQFLLKKNADLDKQTYEIREQFSLCNPDTGMFILSVSELKSHNPNFVYLFKNCFNEAKSVVQFLDNAYNEIIIDNSKSGSSELKSLAFKLKNYFSVDHFAEEFISYEGIKKIIDIIKVTSGNTRSYVMNGFKTLLLYLNSIEYIKENSSVIEDLYEILMHNDNINTITYTLGILILICDFLKEDGVKVLYEVIESYSSNKNTETFSEFIAFINDSNIDIKLNAITLICLIFKYTEDKVTKAKLLINFNDSGINKYLEKNAECTSHEFQIQLTNFQKLTGEIIRGSNYEIEIYKKKFKEIEKHCYELEKKVEFIFMNQKFYDEITEDFSFYSKLANACETSGAYFDPCNFNLFI